MRKPCEVAWTSCDSWRMNTFAWRYITTKSVMAMTSLLIKWRKNLDNRPNFFYNVRLTVGSGFEFSERALFSDHEEDMKEVCKKYSKYGPLVSASLCPIFKSSEGVDSDREFHPFVIWLLQNYGGNKSVLDELHGNIETFHWTGSMLPLIKEKLSVENKISVWIS